MSTITKATGFKTADGRMFSTLDEAAGHLYTRRIDEAVHARRAAEEIAAREADKTHRACVNREAMAGLIAGGLGEEWAKRVVEMICRREVPHVAITY